MKRYAALFLAAVMLLGLLTACGGSPAEGTGAPAAESVQSPADAPDADAAAEPEPAPEPTETERLLAEILAELKNK